MKPYFELGRPFTLVAAMSFLTWCSSAVAQTAREVTYTPHVVAGR